MVQSPSWEANWFAASQEVPRISRNPKVHYRTLKRPPPVSILGQPIPVHIPTSHLLEIRPNIIHPSKPRSPQWSLSLRFPYLHCISVHIYAHAGFNFHFPTNSCAFIILLPPHTSAFYTGLCVFSYAVLRRYFTSRLRAKLQNKVANRHAVTLSYTSPSPTRNQHGGRPEWKNCFFPSFPVLLSPTQHCLSSIKGAGDKRRGLRCWSLSVATSILTGSSPDPSPVVSYP